MNLCKTYYKMYEILFCKVLSTENYNNECNMTICMTKVNKKTLQKGELFNAACTSAKKQ